MRDRSKPIASFELNDKFVVFEDDIRARGKVRVFLNNVDNSQPVHFYLDLNHALLIARDLMDMREIKYSLYASGGGEREMEIFMHGDDTHFLNIANRRDGDVDWRVNEIQIPPRDGRLIGASLLLRLLTGM